MLHRCYLAATTLVSIRHCFLVRISGKHDYIPTLLSRVIKTKLCWLGWMVGCFVLNVYIVWDLSHNYTFYWNLIASCSLIMCFFKFARILHLQTCDDLFNICLSVTFATCASELFCRNCFQIKVQPASISFTSAFLTLTHANIDRRSVICEANIRPQNLSQIF